MATGTYESLETFVDEEIDADFRSTDEVKYIVIDFPEGERYAVSARFVAEERALYYAKKDHPDDKDKRIDCFLDEREYALNNELELYDWVRNNMNWGDLEDEAIRLEREHTPLSEQWFNGIDLEVKDVSLEADDSE